MSTRVLAPRGLALGALFAVALAPGAAAATEPSMAQCYDAHETGQLQRKRGELRNARLSFATCGRNVCPAIVQRDCVSWASELAEKQPTVVIAVVTADGTDVLGAHVFVDGVPTSADGRSLELDPGEHRVRVERVGEPPSDHRFAVREGDHARRVPVVLGGPPGESVRSKPPMLTYVFGSVAVLSLASFGTFAYLGKTRENELGTSCGDRCTDDEVNGVRRSYLAADISLGIAVVAAGAAVVSWLVNPKTSPPTRQARLDR